MHVLDTGSNVHLDAALTVSPGMLARAMRVTQS
jgi:hypothetical protein